MVAPRFDDSRWLDQAAIAALAGASFARCSRSFVTPRYGYVQAPSVGRFYGTQGKAPVARRKRSAPAKHSARSADGGTEL